MGGQFHEISAGEAVRRLESHAAEGLSPGDAARRLATSGRNVLPEEEGTPAWRMLAAQFTGFLIVILIAAAAVSTLLHEWVDAMAILAIVVLNGLLGFFQEYRAERSLEALKKFTVPVARVIRGGKTLAIPASEIVPGDLVEVSAGDRIPADLRLLSAQQLAVDESPLTGESLPVSKNTDSVHDAKTPLGDRLNMLYTGTAVRSGKARGLVVATGGGTEMGKIARLLREVKREPTPLQVRLEELGRSLALICLGICVLVFVAYGLRGEPLITLFLASVSLAVAAIPEGLPAIVTMALSIGVQKMARRNTLVRKLASVETLGSTSVVGTDKTGTLTCNEMTVREMFVEGMKITVSGQGYEPAGEFRVSEVPASPADWKGLHRALEICALCNNASLRRVEGGERWEIIGDPTEGALLTLAAKGGVLKEEALRSQPILDEIPFSSSRKMMTVIVEGGMAEPTALTKGAPDVVLERCTQKLTGEGVSEMAGTDRERILAENEEMASRALRVIGLAYRSGVAPSRGPAVEEELVWVGLVGMMDPPRPEVPPAILRAREAGITPVIITGDHKATALAVAREIGALLPEDQAISGRELDDFSAEELDDSVDRYRVYARVTAEHKLRIIQAWKKRGEFIAMTGDGVNDAPALKEADIGIAMGITGTDVTKESSDMVLMDDNFASIIAAVEEGRGIFDNMRKFITFLLSCNAGEVMVMFLAALAGLPLPLLPIQILWVNLVTDGLPALALGLEPHDPNLMRQPPRRPDEPILDRPTVYWLLLQGVLIAFATLLAFGIQLSLSGDVDQARTAAFAVLSISQLAHAFNCRDRTRSLFELGFLSNRYMIGAVAISMLLLAAAVEIPFLQPVFRTYSLSAAEWLRVFALGFIPLPVMEAIKRLRRSPSRENEQQVPGQ